MCTARTVIAVLPLVSAIIVSADTSRPELRAIAELNDCIQQRFLDITEYVGYPRIIKPDFTPHQFTPENDRERGVVRSLEAARLDVAVYLAGQRVLRSRHTETEYGLPKGPGRIANGSGKSWAPPKASELLNDSREALLAFRTGRSYEFSGPIGDWKMIARPVRASEQKCIKCHAPLRLGDTIGVVVYAYRGGAETP